jgi:hypothetical protein
LEATAPDPDDDATVSWDKEQLSSEECILAIPISYRSLKRNIEGNSILNTLDVLARKRFALDNEDLGINGDTTSDNAFLKQQDGWVKLAKTKGRTFNTHALDTYQKKLDALIFNLPEAYRDSDQNLIIMNDEDANDYVNELGGRVDGVSWLTKGQIPPWKSRAILALAKWPKGVFMFTPSTNLAYGIEQRIEKEIEKHAKPRYIDIVYTCYQDYAIAVPEAISIGWDQDA